METPQVKEVSEAGGEMRKSWIYCFLSDFGAGLISGLRIILTASSEFF